VALAETVTSDVGGLSMRKSPVGWKQAQGAVGNLQATLYAQVRTWNLDLEQRYQITLSVTSPLYPWVVRHAQWLMNRYLQKFDGLTSYEKRWGNKYVGSLCNCGDTVQFRKPGMSKAEPSFTFSIWPGHVLNQMFALLLMLQMFSRQGLLGDLRPQNKSVSHFYFHFMGTYWAQAC